jgi:hypothetical protein
MGPNYYPPDGHDWVATDAIRKLSEHNEALMAEQYAEQLREFRTKFFGKLASHGAMDWEQRNGWAMFHAENQDDSGLAMGDRPEVLLTCRLQLEGDQPDEDNPIPHIRIVTNETVIGEEKISKETGTYIRPLYYLTEDITISPNGDAQYLPDAVNREVASEEVESEAEQKTLVSYSPLFYYVNKQVMFSPNTPYVTPVLHVKADEDSKESVTPFGIWGNLEDRLYALHKARKMLDSLDLAEPSHAYDPTPNQS